MAKQNEQQGLLREESQEELERRLGRHPSGGVTAGPDGAKSDANSKTAALVVALTGAGMVLLAVSGLGWRWFRWLCAGGGILLLLFSITLFAAISAERKSRPPEIRDGEWYWARITRVERQRGRKNTAWIYSLHCEAEGKQFVCPVRQPVRLSCTGGWAAVCVSRSQPDLYAIDEERLRLEYGEEGVRSSIYREINPGETDSTDTDGNPEKYREKIEQENAVRETAEDILFDDADVPDGSSKEGQEKNE